MLDVGGVGGAVLEQEQVFGSSSDLLAIHAEVEVHAAAEEAVDRQGNSVETGGLTAPTAVLV
jgi:hypothetical protein